MVSSDISTAYLNAEIDHEIYMKQAPGSETNSRYQVYKLIKAIYGLKQSSTLLAKSLLKSIFRLFQKTF